MFYRKLVHEVISWWYFQMIQHMNFLREVLCRKLYFPTLQLVLAHHLLYLPSFSKLVFQQVSVFDTGITAVNKTDTYQKKKKTRLQSANSWRKRAENKQIHAKYKAYQRTESTIKNKKERGGKQLLGKGCFLDD